MVDRTDGPAERRSAERYGADRGTMGRNLTYDDLQGTGDGETPPQFFMWRLDDQSFDVDEAGAHRHNFQEVILVESGDGLHRIDGQPSTLVPGSIALIAKGQVHEFDYARSMSGFVLRFADDMLPPGVLAGGPDVRARLFHPLGVGRALRLGPADREEIGALFRLIFAEHERPDATGQDGVLRHLLAALLVRLDRLRQEQHRDDAPGEDAARRDALVYQDFLALLERRYRERRDVASYAEALLLTPDQLSRALAAATGKTAKQLIAERVALEAQRYLQYTSLSVKEIADELGFGDQFRFSRAFKAAVGVSPQAFRDGRRKTS